uniref:Nose resistant to fluoxetine protein 6 n=1 Tax=Toxocara canis TaxID=6265 RepID=A0A183VF26_TOXCA
LETYWPDVYVKPYIRCPPYLIGLLVGFALHKFGLHPVFPKVCSYHISLFLKFSIAFFIWKIALGWAISTIFGIGSVFGLYDYARTGEISEWMRVGYVLFGRNGYALSLAWVTFACATGYGGDFFLFTCPINSLLSWRAWIPLSRITFCAYLIHPILLQIYNFSRPHPFHFTTVYQMFYLFAVAVVMAYFTGFFLSLAFEVPVSILETLAVNRIMAKLRGPRRKKMMCDSDGATTSANRVEVKLLLGEANEKQSSDSKCQQNGSLES